MSFARDGSAASGTHRPAAVSNDCNHQCQALTTKLQHHRFAGYVGQARQVDDAFDRAKAYRVQLVGRPNPAPLSTPAPGMGAGSSTPVPGFASRVLLVDDDPDITRLLGRQLAAKGLDSCTSHNCREALAALEREHFAVVVVDYALPTQTGASIIEHIHHRRIDTAVILLTASMSIMTAVDCTARGSVFRILTKPVAYDEFVQAVHEAGCFAERFLNPSRAA